MRRIWISVAMAVVPGLVPGVSMAAAGPGAQAWLDTFGSWSTYSMEKVNNDVATINDDLAGSGLHMDEIQGGIGLGIRAGVDRSAWSFGIGYDRYAAASDVADATNGIRLEFPANAWYGLGEFRVHGSKSTAVRLGASAGIVTLAPVARIAQTGGFGQTFELHGTGPLFEGYATGEWWPTTDFGLFGSTGYRYAKIDEPKVEPPPGSYHEIDYSGILVRLGVRFALSRQPR